MGEPLISPCNFKNAITDPVNVIAPIDAPIDISTKLAVFILFNVPNPKASGL